MKIRLPKWGPLDYLCVSRPPRSAAPSSVCARVRNEGKGREKVYFTEILSTRTGKSLGYLGPNCTVVDSKAKAYKSDHLNKGNAVSSLYSCLPGHGFGPHRTQNKEFMKAVRGVARKR